MADLHPHALHALTALSSLRRATEHYLSALVEASAGSSTPAATGQTRPRPRAALRRLDDLLRVERHERIVADRAGIHQVGASPTPIPAHLLDAQQTAAQALIDAVWIASSALRERPLLVWGDAWTLAATDRWRARCGWLTMVLPLTPPTAAGDVARILTTADRSVRAACRTEPDEAPVPGVACPACGIRRLRIATSAPSSAAWTITCRPQCRCAGDGCPCGMAVTASGVRHIWAAESALAGEVLDAIRPADIDSDEAA